MFGIVDGSEVVCLQCSKEFLFSFHKRRRLEIDDWMSSALNCILSRTVR